MDWLRRVFGPARSDEVVANGSSSDELREAKALRREHKRHVDFITGHVDAVAERIRADYREHDDRLARNR